MSANGFLLYYSIFLYSRYRCTKNILPILVKNSNFIINNSYMFTMHYNRILNMSIETCKLILDCIDIAYGKDTV